MKEDKIIAIIKDKDFNLPEKELDNPIVRYASRGIVIDDKGKIAIINKKIKNEYKLPGGGIELWENKDEAFLREVYEETGCKISIIDYLGITIEEKGETNFKQISYVFLGKVLEKTHTLHLTEKETMEKTQVLWESLTKGIRDITSCESELKGSVFDSRYQSLFMVRRDAKILKYYKEYRKSR